ncbi:hypothetical protein PV328_005727 [Microctonus aethiopoides]|uniref:Uncharacterized protein n=1 Tax=Microctonus aethiopoides TaxID=144406 RepID=A0AA39FMK5_9HYME|nr:hypothetical protein PV328_005727 [Microctonus aethiopoides]
MIGVSRGKQTKWHIMNKYNGRSKSNILEVEQYTWEVNERWCKRCRKREDGMETENGKCIYSRLSNATLTSWSHEKLIQS